MISRDTFSNEVFKFVQYLLTIVASKRASWHDADFQPRFDLFCNALGKHLRAAVFLRSSPVGFKERATIVIRPREKTGSETVDQPRAVTTGPLRVLLFPVVNSCVQSLKARAMKMVEERHSVRSGDAKLAVELRPSEPDAWPSSLCWTRPLRGCSTPTANPPAAWGSKELSTQSGLSLRADDPW